jgi:hypothetical protein
MGNPDFSRKLSLCYKDSFTYLMFSNWGWIAGETGSTAEPFSEGEIISRIKDSTIDYSPELTASWVATIEPSTLPELSAMEQLLANDDHCLGNPPQLNSFRIHSAFVLPDLEPNRMYNSVFISKYRNHSETEFTESKVHSYNFQTSRYPNFFSQLNSYRLKDPKRPDNLKEAIFTVPVDLTITSGNPEKSASEQLYDLLIALQTGNQDMQALQGEFPDPFDRILTGFLKIQELPPAISQEYNHLIIPGAEPVDDVLIALLIRNPEPIGDPRMPDEEWEGTSGVLQVDYTPQTGSGVTNSNLFKVWSKDKARVLIFNKQLDSPSGFLPLFKPMGEINYTFRYKESNPLTREYDVKEGYIFNI